MSGTSSEYQRGFDDGAAKRDPVSLADARAESYRKGWADALSRLLGAAEVQAASESGTGDREYWEDVASILRTASPSGPTAPQVPSQLPTSPETPAPATAQHNGSVPVAPEAFKPTTGIFRSAQAYQENDDGA